MNCSKYIKSVSQQKRDKSNKICVLPGCYIYIKVLPNLDATFLVRITFLQDYWQLFEIARVSIFLIMICMGNVIFLSIFWPILFFLDFFHHQMYWYMIIICQKNFWILIALIRKVIPKIQFLWFLQCSHHCLCFLNMSRTFPD